MSFCDKNLRAMTLTEMIVAMAILVIVMAAIFPQIHCIQKSWAHAQSSSEILQNGRVLMDHFTSSLGQSKKVTAVSAADVANGFIEYRDTDGSTLRYDLSPAGYVGFGPVGTLSQLAGPATKLQFACYDINSVATTDPNRIRMVSIEAVIEDAADHQTFKSFTTNVFIRTGASIQPIPVVFDAISGKDPALCAIDTNHHLCVYEGSGSNGYAVVLGTNTTTAAVTLLSSYEFDASTGKTPALTMINATHYLCAYEGPSGDGWAVILQVNPSTWAISKGTPFEYDTSNGQQPALARIDATHYLCTYNGASNNGYAVILTVNTGTGVITKGTTFTFDSDTCSNPTFAKIDATHYLCVYTGKNSDGYAAILVPDMSADTVTKIVSFEFNVAKCDYPAVAQIDAARYLCTYAGQNNDGSAVILTAGITPPAITRSAAYEFDAKNGLQSSLTKINSTHYLCVYVSDKNVGQYVLMQADPATGQISTATAAPFDQNRCIATSLSQIDATWVLCAYEGSGNKGYAVMIDTNAKVLP